MNKKEYEQIKHEIDEAKKFSLWTLDAINKIEFRLKRVRYPELKKRDKDLADACGL